MLSCMIKETCRCDLEVFRGGDFTGLPRRTQYNHRVLIKEQEGQNYRETWDCMLLALEMEEGNISEEIQSASRR